MRQGYVFVLCAGALLALAGGAGAQNFLDQNYGFDVITDVVYGQAQITSPSTQTVDLKCDIYVPTGVDLPRRMPALICVHGGRWSGGTKSALDNTDIIENGSFYDNEGTYAREFAKRGYVCLSIDYRLADSLPPGTGLFAGIPGFDTSYLVSRMQSWNGTPFTNAQCIAEMEAAISDAQAATQWLRQHSGEYGVDVNRIAMGGWSNGGTVAILAAYAAGENLRAVWMNSGTIGTGNNFLIAAGGPATIFFHGDSDGEIPAALANSLNNAFDSAGVANAYYQITGEDSYYLRNVIVPSLPAKELKGGATLEDTLADFLHAEMDLDGLEAENLAPLPVAGGGSFAVLTALLCAAGAAAILRRPRMQVARVKRD